VKVSLIREIEDHGKSGAAPAGNPVQKMTVILCVDHFRTVGVSFTKSDSVVAGHRCRALKSNP
jgi:hypothetical protein